MKRRPAPAFLWVLCTLCVLCGDRAAFAAVADYLGRPIGSVRLLTEGRETVDPVLTQVVETVAGQPLSMAQVRESVAHLFSLGRFEDVRVDATLEGGLVMLRYDLVPIHPVTRIRFTGGLNVPGIDAGDLHRAVVDRYGASPPLGRLADMSRIIDDALRERGYLHAAIVPHPEVEHAPEHATLVFTIDPGPRTTIGTVAVVGRPTVPEAEFLSRLRLTTGAPYQRDALNVRIERYVAERRKRGYYEAKVLPAVQFAEEDRVAHVTLTVSSGPHVRVGFTGDPLPSDKREDLVPVEREGSVDEDLLEDSSNRIEEALRVQGYRDAAAPHTRKETNGELLVTFNVKRGQQYRVSTFEISGNRSVPLADLAPSLRLRDGQPFSEARLDADLATVQDLYRRRGFASAKAQPAVEIVTATPPFAQVPVAVRIVVSEGVRTVVDGVTFTGHQALNDAALRAAIGLQPGMPFVPGQLAVDRDAIQIKYQNLGYETATVDARPEFNQNGTNVAIEFTIREGPQVFVDHVLIVGNLRTSTQTIERALQLKQGDPFNAAAINASQRLLVALGLFRRAQISELRHGAENLRDVLVTIEEAPPTSIGYGGGVEGKLRRVRETSDGNAVDTFLLAPRASFDIGRRNLFGKNRSLSLSTSVAANRLGLQPGAPLDTSSNVTEYRVVGTFREPRLFDTPIDAFVNMTFEQQIRSSFAFSRRSLSATAVRRLPRGYSVTSSYQLQRTDVFNQNVLSVDQPLIDRTFQQFLLSSFSGSATRDTRNDAVDPTAGEYTSGTVQLAARAIGSEFGFAKSYFTTQLFRPIPRAPGVVFAGNAALGMANGFNVEGQLKASERFFAGGDTTNRGFALDQLGVRHVPAQPGDTIDEDGFAIGGNGLLVLMGELRAHVKGGFGVVGFVDTGNVFARVADIDVTEFRTSVGGGIRYKSPIGPLRVDGGFKIHRQPGEGPTAWFVSFGQAF